MAPKFKQSMLEEDEKIVHMIIKSYYSWVKIIDVINAFLTVLSLYLQIQVAEQQIAYVTESEKIDVKEIYYRRVLYVDLSQDSNNNVLRIINFATCALTALLLIPRYWLTLRMLKASHRVPEGTGIFWS